MPQWRRFLNADTFFVAGEDVLCGSNMYAYCNGNPVMYSDPTGQVPEWLKKTGEFLWNAFLFVVIGIPALIWIIVTDEGTQESFGKFIDMLGHWNWVATDVLPMLGSLFGLVGNAITNGPRENSPLAQIGAGIGQLFAGDGFIAQIGGFFGGFFDFFRRIVDGIWKGPDGGIEFDINATGYMLIGANGETIMGAPAPPPGGGGQLQASGFQLTMGADVNQINLFYNASGSFSGLQSAVLTVNLGTHAGANVDWGKSNALEGIQWTPDKGATTTVTAYNNGSGPSQKTLTAWVSTPGRSIGTASVRVLSIKMTYNLNALVEFPMLTMAGPLPQLYPNPVPGRLGLITAAGHGYQVIGNYKDFVLVSVPGGPAQGPRYVFFLHLFWPVPTKNDYSDSWGWRRHPYEDDDGKYRVQLHKGVDVGAGNKDHEIVAIASGKVIYSRNTGGARGYAVVIEHEITGVGKFYSLYQHLKSTGRVAFNTSIEAGEKVGDMGSTGLGGWHLHFEIMRKKPSMSAFNTGGIGNTKDLTINPLDVYVKTRAEDQASSIPNRVRDKRQINNTNNANTTNFNPQPFFVKTNGSYRFNPDFKWNEMQTMPTKYSHSRDYGWLGNSSEEKWDPNS